MLGCSKIFQSSNTPNITVRAREKESNFVSFSVVSSYLTICGYIMNYWKKKKNYSIPLHNVSSSSSNLPSAAKVV